jgi:tRNA pseudouridine55 synthase
MDGFLTLLKPPGMTSSDAVLFLRKRLPRGTRVGHGGTLDPDAAGVLPICLGKATRLFDYFIDKDKEYITEACFGASTDTQDASGRVVERCGPVPEAEAIIHALPSLTGEILQRPPAFSAIKQKGKRMYELARQGKSVDVPPRAVRVDSLDYLCKLDYNRHVLRVVCGKGVYIRTLVNDLGQILGCPAHMSFLLRTRSGAFTLEQACTIEQLEEGLPPPLPLDTPLGYMPALQLGESFRHAVRNGNPLRVDHGAPKDTLFRVYLSGQFAGIAAASGEGILRFRAMLL